MQASTLLTGISHAQAQLLELVAQLNADASINGILVQLPLPAHINADKVVQSVLPIKVSRAASRCLQVLSAACAQSGCRWFAREEPRRSCACGCQGTGRLLLASESLTSAKIAQAGLISCTPLGVIELLDQHRIEVSGKHAVVIGRSNLVGKPLGLLLLR